MYVAFYAFISFLSRRTAIASLSPVRLMMIDVYARFGAIRNAPLQIYSEVL